MEVWPELLQAIGLTGSALMEWKDWLVQPITLIFGALLKMVLFIVLPMEVVVTVAW